MSFPFTELPNRVSRSRRRRYSSFGQTTQLDELRNKVLKYNRRRKDSGQYRWMTCFSAGLSHLMCLNVVILMHIRSFVLMSCLFLSSRPRQF